MSVVTRYSGRHHETEHEGWHGAYPSISVRLLLEELGFLFDLVVEADVFEFEVFLAGRVDDVFQVRLERVFKFVDDLLKHFFFGRAMSSLSVVPGDQSEDCPGQVLIFHRIALDQG